MTSPPASESHAHDAHRRAFLLHQLATAPDGKRTQADANKRTPKQLQDELALPPADANDLRATMTAQGLLEVVAGRSVTYAITAAGRVWLRKNEAFIPLLPAKGEVNPQADPAVQEARVAWLLLQLLGLPAEGATPSVLNKKGGPKRLDLNAATSRQVRGELVVRGLIAVARTARSERYTLTPAGLAHLAALSFDQLGTLKLSGSVLTTLLKAARTGVSAVAAPTPLQPAAISSAQLKAMIVDLFGDLLRERYANIRMVPIHDLRAEVARRFGDHAASHAVFDELLLGLRRAGTVRLISISDRSRATADQLRDSIFDVGETFFYVGTGHAPASGG